MGCGHDHGLHIAAFRLDRPAGTTVIGAGGKAEAGHGTDTGQGLATKAQGFHPFQVVQIMNLAGGMAGDSERKIILAHATAVIPHPNQLDATLFHLHIQPLRTGIEAVFQQLLNHGRGAFHHLAGGDLIGKSG